ncbi:MAG: undecaprenyldiphospho-muramoylpentapeptide beta-N-acetylglucosaminyltransferase [Bradyrhizobiaceae bacterium]|nr:undecaprenyldiphospho-muramoylpentapeptide beta-N-acetylglucosaminyltransferase [Bradyrhizobiaceae bacterium]
MSEEHSGQPLVFVAAGGTGGHLFPAEALALALAQRGVTVDLVTDERATRYGDFPGRTTRIVPSATFAGPNPLRLAVAAVKLCRGAVTSLDLMKRLRPAAVVGFGGYPTIPPLFAATTRKIPTVIHEANGVLGRANRLMGRRVQAIATGFSGLLADDPQLGPKVTHTGNPIRPAVVAVAGMPYPDATGPLRILVFGGSQGARIMADVVPAAIELVPMALRARLSVTQQARDEDVGRVRAAYDRFGLAVEIEPFFRDLPARIAHSHLVISRSGASTVAELAAIGRPAILVPLPHSLDQDQRANAAMLERVGGAILMDQSRFTPGNVAAEIARLADAPGTLADMAAAAKAQGVLDAADRLADLVLQVAGLAPPAPDPRPDPFAAGGEAGTADAAPVQMAQQYLDAAPDQGHA